MFGIVEENLYSYSNNDDLHEIHFLDSWYTMMSRPAALAVGMSLLPWFKATLKLINPRREPIAITAKYCPIIPSRQSRTPP